MGTCWNCNTQISLGEERTKCDKCGQILFYHCNNCTKEFKIEDRKTKKKLKECKLCGYFNCPNCNICYHKCQKYDWEKEILKILKPEITQGNIPNLLPKVKRIIAYMEDEKSGQERKVCSERGVLVSYAKNRIKGLLAKVEGFNIKNENDRDAFIKRLDEITEKEIGTELRISEVREAGNYGQEYRDAFSLLICLGKLKIDRRKFIKDGKEIKDDVYIRCELQPCRLLSQEDLIINTCQNPKHKGNKRFLLDLEHCPSCKPHPKGKNVGEQWKLKERLNDKDTCQMYRGDFVNIKV
jgi:hypothetical protein|tara:strand:- start:1403 stop:2290 length:888 start_codon:yes stop_codon:yes gene_type:complete